MVCVVARQSGSSCLALDLLAVMMLVVVCTATAQGSSAADGYSLEVGTDQRVTVSGSSPSLKDLVVELCGEAEVELLAFGAADRPVSLNYEDIALSELLERLLRSENYMVGLRAGAGSAAVRIAWLRVIGENDTGPVAAASSGRAVGSGVSGAGQRGPNASPGFIVDLFAASGDPARRDETLRNVRALLESNSEERKAFFRADPDELARRIAGYPGARGLMVILRRGRYEYFTNVHLARLSAALDRALRMRDSNQ